MESMNKFCSQCGAPVQDGNSFCSICGASLAAQPVPQEKPSAFSGAANALKRCTAAPAFAGETAIGESGIFGGGGVMSAVGPFKLIFSEAAGYFRSIVSAFKDVKRLIPAIVLAVIWVTLILLPRLGVNPLPVKILSLVTFAQGGISNNIIRMLGGIVGKGVFAYLITALIVPVFRGKNPFKTIGSGIKNTIDRFKNIGKNIAPLLAGAGIALIFYNFIAGYASLWKSMGAVAAMLLSFRAAGSNGLLTRFFNSLFNRKAQKVDAKSLISGFAAGFALAIPVSAIPFVYICYCAGGGLILVSIITAIVKSIMRKGAMR